MSRRVLAFRITNRITSIMWASGLNLAMDRAQSGMLSSGVKRPPMRMKIMRKKKITNTAARR